LIDGHTEEAKGEEENMSLAYKNLPYHIYFISTVIQYVLILFGAIVIIDIGVIFELISAIVINLFCNMLPGVLYILAERKFSLTNSADNTVWNRRKAYFFVIYGAVMMVIQLSAAVIEIIEDAEHPGGHSGE
jgi:magnesium-transporting ATPase (P-type)